MMGVVLQTYGQGNAPDMRKDLLEVMREACDRGVIVVNITQCAKGNVSPIYAVGKVGCFVIKININCYEVFSYLEWLLKKCIYKFKGNI